MMRTMSVLACLAGLAGVAESAAPPQLHPSWVLLPAGATDRSGKVGYFQNPKGGIDAIDLATGEVLWQTKTVCHPVALIDGRLIGWMPYRVEDDRIADAL
jgi:hypothetical protein